MARKKYKKEIDPELLEEDPDEEVEWTEETIRMFGGDVPPAGCMACGGPYPDCKISCKMFDD